VTRRSPERMLLGSVAVPDIVLAHWVSDRDPGTSGVRRPLAVAVPVARWPTLRRNSAAIFPRPVRGP
jgi:hypothetical protein